MAVGNLIKCRVAVDMKTSTLLFISVVTFFSDRQPARRGEKLFMIERSTPYNDIASSSRDRNHARKTMLPSRLMSGGTTIRKKRRRRPGREQQKIGKLTPPYSIAAEKGNHCYQLHEDCHLTHSFHGGKSMKIAIVPSIHKLKLVFSHVVSFSHFSGSFIH